VPISIRKRGGQKLVLAADGTINTWAPPSRRIDNAMVKAVARAFRWCEMLETGTHGMINETYVGRVLRLTLLAPDIVEAIMIGRQPSKMTLAMLMRRFPTGWRPNAMFSDNRLASPQLPRRAQVAVRQARLLGSQIRAQR
jgi:hypothetical protein